MQPRKPRATIAKRKVELKAGSNCVQVAVYPSPAQREHVRRAAKEANLSMSTFFVEGALRFAAKVNREKRSDYGPVPKAAKPSK